MTQPPQEGITRAQADEVCQQWEAELGGEGPARACAWQQVDELFRQQQYPSWLAAQYFVAQADRLSGAPDVYPQQLATLQVRHICLSPGQCSWR